MADCTQNTDPLKLLRDGTSQEQRFAAALDPAYAPVNEHRPEHRIVFAQAYAAYLTYYDATNTVAGDWTPFFSADLSAQLAVAAVQDVAYYRQQVREYTDFLNDRQHESDPDGLRKRLDYLFSSIATLAIGFNQLSETLPGEIALKKSLQNLVRSQLTPALRRLIAYHKGGDDFAADDENRPLNTAANEVAAPLTILGASAVKFSVLATTTLSKDWIADPGKNWADYYNDIKAERSIYGNPAAPSVFAYANHIATHNLFTSILDQFLKVYARTVSDAKAQLGDTYTNWDRHQPHYALFLAFLRLLEYARAEANTLTGRHLDFYYRDLLQLEEKAAEPGNAHLLVELAKQAPSYLVKAGELFKAGKDDLGNEAFFANDRAVVVNQAKVTALMTLYRHDDEALAEEAPTGNHEGRFYAAPVANSDDGLGAELTSVDQSWHPFHNKVYDNGKLQAINMPEAEIGFAIASHYLLMAEGTRTITVDITANAGGDLTADHKDDVICLLTAKEGWLEKAATSFKTISGVLRLTITLSGDDPAITPYLSSTHGYTFGTNLPILLIKLQHRAASPYLYAQLQDMTITKIALQVAVAQLKTLAVSNDFGPVDTAKPFQPYGASPVANSALVIGSKEVFQKQLTSAQIVVSWLLPPNPYVRPPDQLLLELFEFMGQPIVSVPVPFATDPAPIPVNVTIDFLQAGQWQPSNNPVVGVGTTIYELTSNLALPVVDEPDFTPNTFYQTGSRHGFVRLKLTRDFGQNAYQADLIKFLRKEAGAEHPGNPPVGPAINELTMSYTATQSIALDSTDATVFQGRKAHFFHLAPFGQAEQHAALSAANKVYLVPQFAFQRNNLRLHSESEFYIGISGLKPPQTLALLFQVVDGTADPLAAKPIPHIHWSYLRNNEWAAFATSQVEELTGGLLNSGIITFALPREATDTNTLLPANLHWIRAAVATESDAVCRLVLVAAQALEATFINKQNDPAFPAKTLAAGTITKLVQPNAAIKKIVQPFPTFGGRGAEAPRAFYTRSSERLRHKDRAIALWDYERLVLEAFPQIYKVKCLNHTQYEPTESGGIYKELAPGHVTIVTIPNQQFQNLRDPLRPYTSLGLLEEIKAFLQQRLSCFVTLHVRNPQFEEVSVAFKVRLHDGFDETFYTTQLQETITRFLSPWAFPGGGRPSFRGKIVKSVLINLVEEQPYVDYLTDFALFHSFIDRNGNAQRVETNEAEGSTAVSILVSVPATDHQIDPIEE